MKAIRIHEHGSVEKLRFEDAPDPRITSPKDVIVKLAAAAPLSTLRTSRADFDNHTGAIRAQNMRQPGMTR